MIAVDVGVAHGLDFEVHGARGAIAVFAQWIALEDVQHLAQHDAAGARGRGRDDVKPAVVTFHGSELARAVSVEIRLRENSLARPAGGHQCRGGFALVEAVGTAPADVAQCSREIALAEESAGLERLTVGEEDGG